MASTRRAFCGRLWVGLQYIGSVLAGSSPEQFDGNGSNVAIVIVHSGDLAGETDLANSIASTTAGDAATSSENTVIGVPPPEQPGIFGPPFYAPIAPPAGS